MTGASSAASVAGSPLPKWQLALVVGAPVAIGLGYMYYKNSTRSSSDSDKIKNSSKENCASIEKQISIDGTVKAEKTTTTIEPETPLQKAQKFKLEGNERFNKGKYDEAILQYNNAIEACPKEKTEELAIFYQNRAAAYEQLEKYSAVKADCSKALELNPRYTKAFLRRARALEKCNDLEAALEDITTVCFLEKFSNQRALVMADRILKQLGRQNAMEYMATSKKHIMQSKYFIKGYIGTFPNDPIFSLLENANSDDLSPGFRKALQALKEERYDDIIPLCTEQLKSSESDSIPHKMELLLLRGTFLLLLGKNTEALKDFETVINSNTASKALKVNALIKRASLHIQLEEPEKTFRDFELAVEIDPECGDIYHHRARVEILMGEEEKAKKDFDKAVELNPNCGITHAQKCYVDYRYGIATRNQDALSSAVSDFVACIEKFPDCLECYILFGQLLSSLQQYQTADSFLTKAIQKDPTAAIVYVHKGLIQLQSDSDVDKALEYIKKALELDDKCEYAYETLGTIEVQRGNLKEAIEAFDRALELYRSLQELTHIFSLRHAAKTQIAIKERLGSDFVSLQNIA